MKIERNYYISINHGNIKNLAKLLFHNTKTNLQNSKNFFLSLTDAEAKIKIKTTKIFTQKEKKLMNILCK